MARALKTTGPAAKASFIVAVDDDGATIREFVSSTVNADMTIDTGVVIGTSTWKGGAVSYFETKASGTTPLGVRFGTNKPACNTGIGNSVGMFIAFIGASTPTGTRGGLVLSSRDTSGDTDRLSLTRSPDTGAAQLRFNRDSERYTGTTALPIDGTTKYSEGANYQYNTAAQAFYGLESGSLGADGAPANPGAYGNADGLWHTIGGRDGFGAFPAKIVVACGFTEELTEAEYQSLHDDPIGTLFEAAAPAIALTPKPTTTTTSGTRTFTITRTTAAPAGGITYNLASSTPAVATVPASVVMAEGTTTKTFDATGASVGSTNISATNAADSGETDTAALTVSAPTTTTLKLLAHIDALSATAVRGAVFQPGTGGNLLGAKIGDFTGEAFEATPEAGQAPLLVPVTSFGGGSLTVSDTPKIVWEATSAAGSALGSGVTIGSTSAQNCTVVEI